MVRALSVALVSTLLATSGPARAEHVCRITGQVVRPCAGDLGAASASLERTTCCDLRVSGAADTAVHGPDRLEPAPAAVIAWPALPAAPSLAGPAPDVPAALSAGPPIWLEARTLLI